MDRGGGAAMGGPGVLRSSGGFSLIEVMVAAVIIAVGLASVYMVSSQCMQVAQSSHNSTLATQIIQEQTERLKAVPFQALLTSGSLNAFLVANPLVSGSGALNGLTETVKISSVLLSGTTTSSGYVSVISSIPAHGAPSVSTLVTGTLTASTVQVQVILGWVDRSGVHSRAGITRISSYE